MVPGDEPEQSEAAAAELMRVVTGASRVTAGRGLHAMLCDGWIVLRDMDKKTSWLHGWTPVSVDRAPAGGTIKKWFGVTWGGPDYVLLPGYHTAAENSLNSGGTGDEVFLLLCGLMSTGSRTVLLSRWRTGGRTSHELVREFAQELAYQPAASAWQRSTILLRHAEIDPRQEPRLEPFRKSDPLRGEHPFFWSGYLLADLGALPRGDR
jgi:hypothetical protein